MTLNNTTNVDCSHGSISKMTHAGASSRLGLPPQTS